MDCCPYCDATGFVADETFSPDTLTAGTKPDDVRWLNRCASCGLWSVWTRDSGQQSILDPEDPLSLE